MPASTESAKRNCQAGSTSPARSRPASAGRGAPSPPAPPPPPPPPRPGGTPLAGEARARIGGARLRPPRVRRPGRLAQEASEELGGRRGPPPDDQRLVRVPPRQLGADLLELGPASRAGQGQGRFQGDL